MWRWKHWQKSWDSIRNSTRLVQITLHTGTADTILSKMNQGLIDLGLFMEPVNTEELEYIRIRESDQWVTGMRPEDRWRKRSLSQRKISWENLLSCRSGWEYRANWPTGLERIFMKLNIAYTSNLGTNAGILAVHGLGYPVSIEGAARYWRNDLLVQKKLYPEIKAGTIIAWRRNIPYSVAVKRLIQNIKAFEA